MRLVRFTQRAFVDGRLWEAGEEGFVSDSVALGYHMIDVETGARGAAPPPIRPARLDHRRDDDLHTTAPQD